MSFRTCFGICQRLEYTANLDHNLPIPFLFSFSIFEFQDSKLPQHSWLKSSAEFEFLNQQQIKIYTAEIYIVSKYSFDGGCKEVSTSAAFESLKNKIKFVSILKD